VKGIGRNLFLGNILYFQGETGENNNKYQHSRFSARSSKSRPREYETGMIATERQVGTVTINLIAKAYDCRNKQYMNPEHLLPFAPQTRLKVSPLIEQIICE
jgi:hypothetical protein